MTFGKWGLLGFGALVAIALGATWALRHRDDGIPAIEFSPADLQKGGRVLPGEHDAMVAACQREFQARLADKTAAVCACLATRASSAWRVPGGCGWPPNSRMTRPGSRPSARG